MEEIEAVLRGVSREKDEGQSADTEAKEYQGIVGVSPGIKRVVRFIQKVKDSALPVLISGESGTGKELVARALHFDSCRRAHPFIAVNCATLKPELLENEFFGHVKGAFTGAVDYKEGLLKAADKGTLFIDEIADMNLIVQASLLRFIETGNFRPLGSNREMVVQTRCVAAVNRNIEDEVREKRFRHDLYYRLNVSRIDIPPLRERLEDIPVLADHFLSKFRRESGREVYLPPEAVERLKDHPWPGNVREFFHVLYRGLILLNPEEDTLTRRHIDRLLYSRSPLGVQGEMQSLCSLEENERRHLLTYLDANDWNISRTAKALAIDRRTLQRKISKYRIRRTPVKLN